MITEKQKIKLDLLLNKWFWSDETEKAKEELQLYIEEKERKIKLAKELLINLK